MLFYIILSIDLFLLLLLIYLFKSKKILLVISILIFYAFTRIFIVQGYKIIVQGYKIPSVSMLPTILIGDHILTNKYIYKFTEPKRGDLVVFPYPLDPSVDYIKRVVAVGGDSIEIIDKILYVNKKQLDEPYVIHTEATIYPSTLGPRDNFGPLTVPENNVFVLGDNRDNSYDSRFWGPVKQNTVKSRVELIYWSLDNKRERIRWERVGKKVQ